MTKLSLIVLTALAVLAPRGAFAAEPNSPTCKRELQVTHKKMDEVLALVTRVQNAPAPEKCKAYSQATDIAGDIRESFARCEPPQSRTEAVHDADDVYDATLASFEKWCPTRPGMVRVHMTEVAHVARDKLPKPLAAIHTCAGEGPMFSSNVRFDLGRLVTLGCPGNANPSATEMKTRNANAELLQKEQVMLYVTRDLEGDDPRRLTFPILNADGGEATTELLFAQRTFVGDKLDRIESYWEPAKDGVCRVNAVWQVIDGKTKLVLWREAADCSAGSKTVFKIVLDRQDKSAGLPGDEFVGQWQNVQPGHPGYKLSRTGNGFLIADGRGGSIDAAYSEGTLFFDLPKGRIVVRYSKSDDTINIGGQVYRRVK